jgi:hypothetical protein
MGLKPIFEKSSPNSMDATLPPVKSHWGAVTTPGARIFETSTVQYRIPRDDIRIEAKGNGKMFEATKRF